MSESRTSIINAEPTLAVCVASMQMPHSPSAKFLIFSPSYHPLNGGSIVLHKLCSLLNELGHDAFLSPLFNAFPIQKDDIAPALFQVARSVVRSTFFKYRTNPSLHTKTLKTAPKTLGKDWIVIYPEIVFGNPLRAKNVVRWFLHRPGFHKRHIFFGEGEYHIDFNNFSTGFLFPGSFKSELKLQVLHLPLEHYNTEGSLPREKRSGTAYCLRKGKNKPIQHTLDGSFLIDGLSHEKVASIFKRVKTFISYDTYTAYSHLAVLCGAKSVVIPDENVTAQQWYPDERDRYGISYGFHDERWAEETAHLVLPRMMEKEDTTRAAVTAFALEALDFFREPHRYLSKLDSSSP